MGNQDSEKVMTDRDEADYWRSEYQNMHGQSDFWRTRYIKLQAENERLKAELEKLREAKG